MVALLLHVPSIGKYHRRPALPAPLLAQATQSRKIHMRPRDQHILAREPGQQLMPRRRSRSLVDVENRGDLGMLQLDAQCMEDVAPKQDFLVPWTKIHSRYVPGYDQAAGRVAGRRRLARSH